MEGTRERAAMATSKSEKICVRQRSGGGPSAVRAGPRATCFAPLCCIGHIALLLAAVKPQKHR